MATAKTITSEIQIELKLSVEEALALKAVTMYVGGNPTTTPRRHIDEIAAALNSIIIKNGLQHKMNAMQQKCERTEYGGINFRI